MCLGFWFLLGFLRLFLLVLRCCVLGFPGVVSWGFVGFVLVFLFLWLFDCDGYLWGVHLFLLILVGCYLCSGSYWDCLGNPVGYYLGWVL